jgi:hypothetical protein
MGTDIHIQVEVKMDGEWIWLAKFLPSFVRTHELFGIPTDRNYNLFGILADVRNGTGFAGCDLGDGFNSIDTPRGLPVDIDPDLLKEHKENWVFGDHSFSYITAKELKEYNWDQVTKLRGWVGIKGYKSFKEDGQPGSYSGGVSGSGVDHVSNEFMDDLIEHPELQKEGIHYVTQVEWEESYRDSIGWDAYWSFSNLYSQVIKYSHQENIQPEHVRIVFGFDG